MANETLSAKQTTKISQELGEILDKCQNDVADAFSEFAEVVSKNWADANAVEFRDELSKIHSEIENTIKNNSQTYADTLKNIADAYIRAGGMSVEVDYGDILRRKNAYEIGLLKALSKIKEMFPDGENFGFKDIDKSSEIITEAFTILKNKLNESALMTVNNIKTINAFGNRTVQLNLAQSAGEIVTIIKNSIEKLQKSLNEKLDATKQLYKKTGSGAETASKISAN